MSRWEPNAQERLADAALELFAEHGFDQVTVDQIARRAGLTRRTFFRHFADKREVLFGGTAFHDAVAAGLSAAPPDAAPLDVVAAGLAAAGELLQGRRAFAVRRQAAIAASRELQERELVKLAGTAATAAAALRDRGVPEPAASVTAEAGVAAFRVAFERWATDPDAPPLPAVIDDALAQLRAVAGR